MVISAITGNSVPMTTPEAPAIDSSVIRQVEDRKTNKDVENIMSTESYVREYFRDIPIMIQIARCESTFRQLDRDGEIHRGRVNKEDVGVMQINEHYHLETSENKNYNIYTLEGNTAYARDLYERQGIKPWSSSKACWGKYLNSDENKELALNSK